MKRSSWPWWFLNDWADKRTLASDQEKLKGSHPALESSNRIKKGNGKEMVQTRSWRRGSGGGAPGSASSVGGAHAGAAVAVG